MEEKEIASKAIREVAALGSHPWPDGGAHSLICTILQPVAPECLPCQKHLVESEDKDENNMQFLPQRVHFSQEERPANIQLNIAG